MYVRDLGLDPASTEELQDARAALREEQRKTTATLELRCFEARVLDEASGLWRLDIGRFPEADWTWEGASASRQADDEDEDDDDSNSRSWKAAVVETDEDHGHLYVTTRGPEIRPCTGTFSVRPFDFLDALVRAYSNDNSDGHLSALRTGLAGAVGARGKVRDPAPSAAGLEQMSRHSWSILWGPPGTGKTHMLGQHVAALLTDPRERVLVVSTTNRATDEAALSIGEAVRERLELTGGRIVRVGWGARWDRFADKQLVSLLAGGELLLRRRLADCTRARNAATDPAERARLSSEIEELRQQLVEGDGRFVDPSLRVVVATAFHATRTLTAQSIAALAANGKAPLTTVIIDEAGLLSRAATAALSVHAAGRVLLAGDPRQLAPISRIARVLPTGEARWIAESALGHLDESAAHAGVHLLQRQYRMHPEICGVVSTYMYAGALDNDPSVTTRADRRDALLSAQPRALWYVLDEDVARDQQHTIRAERGPGNRSWIRRHSSQVLGKLLQQHVSLRAGSGLFITPFRAQARAVRDQLATAGIVNWTASSIHAQQGAQADWVILDTVHASSTAWPHAEWKRLVNVGMSRAREQLILLASRDEMSEPYMHELADHLRPVVFKGVGGKYRWIQVDAAPELAPAARLRSERRTSLGAQIEARKALRPVLSAEQQRLCGYALDGKPRLVRGVAGSGKTVVLAAWVVRSLVEHPDRVPIRVVYANAALGPLIRSAIDSWWAASRTGHFPWESARLDTVHILDLLKPLEATFGLEKPDNAYDYDGRADAILEQARRQGRSIPASCAAMFIDEAQDMGPRTIELLGQLVRAGDPASRNRSVNIFYDNAQNIYERGTPKWSELGLDMQGRSTVMKESFRSTRPNVELALNTLARLVDVEGDEDHLELLRCGLVDKTVRNGRPWWVVRFNRVDGPWPEFRRFANREQELVALVARVESWIVDDGVRPVDIRVVANSWMRNQVAATLSGTLRRHGIEVRQQTSGAFSSSDNVLVVTTAHSFKGHESEITVVPCADRFFADHTILAKALYVAMTRARSLLYVSAIDRQGDAGRIVEALDTAYRDLRSTPETQVALSPDDVMIEIEARMGPGEAEHLAKLRTRADLTFDPILRADGSILAEPLFWWTDESKRFAYFVGKPERAIVNDIEDAGIVAVLPGELARFANTATHRALEAPAVVSH